MEKLVKMINELSEARKSHPAIKLFNERASEAAEVSLETAKAVAGVETVNNEAVINANDEAAETESRMMQLELLWDIRESLKEVTAPLPSFKPVPAAEPGEHEISLLAGELYEEYCAAVDGVDINGVELQTWEEMSSDHINSERDAWMQVAGKAIAILG